MSEETTKVLNCAKCGKQLSDMDVTYALDNSDENVEERVCQQCSEDVSNEYAEQTQNINYIGALVGSLIGAAIGVAIWYFVAIIFDLTVGYVAIAVGWLVGFGAMLGAGNKRGIQLQILSAVITLLAIFTAEYLVIVWAFNAAFTEIFGAAHEFVWLPVGEVIEFVIEFEIYDFINYIIWALGLFTAFVTPQPKKLGK